MDPTAETDDASVSVSASVSLPDPEMRRLYVLNFKIRCNEIRKQHTFLLEDTSSLERTFRRSTSQDTSSDEVLQLTREWIASCQCHDTSEPAWYPSRLISLKNLKNQAYYQGQCSGFNRDFTNTTLKLVETDTWEECIRRKDPHYVTLSHCWGKVVSDEHKLANLTSDNIEAYKSGIQLMTLPKTFRDTLKFAARLPGVDFVWIDSLCIKQGDTVDWLKESAHMDKVYERSFLNISATAASHSGEGLFGSFKPESLLGYEVILNIEGLSAVTSGDEQHNVRTCTITDLSYWTNHINGGPVNRRGWVFQERLMASRVLHFCHDRVAWECRNFQTVEGQSDNVTRYWSKSENIREGSRLKGLDIASVGRWLRSMRLDDYDDPDPHLQPGIYGLEVWRRMVEIYSTTALTNGKDKLIALSGMARWMSRRIERSAQPAQLRNPDTSRIIETTQYVAGLWSLHLASQLLWFTEPVFRQVDGKFQHLTVAPESYRAPSFSWASIDADKGNGITYAEVTDKDLLITIEEVSVTPISGSDEFGVLENAHIILWGQLRQAVLSKKTNENFEWRLVRRDAFDNGDDTVGLVHLDCPVRDTEAALGEGAGVYVVPAAKSDRTASEESKYLTCLLLQLDPHYNERSIFRRIGLTKLSPCKNYKTIDEILKVRESDAMLPHQGYNHQTGMHRIVIH